ncbi:MAG: autotransporter domain-containing protein [Akkermansia sp.]|nr:autotransporter domain-containing protein [Akkermansia sp.]
MKFHLPKKLFTAVMAAVISTQAFAEENKPQITFGDKDSTDAVVTITGGDFSKFNMYGDYKHNPVAMNCVGGAATAETNSNGGALEKEFTSATVNMSGGTLGTLMGQGLPGSIVTGDTTINVSGGSINYIKGGTDYPSSYNRNTDIGGVQYAGNDYQYKSTFDNPEAEKQNININVSGGHIGQIRGGHNGKHKEYVIDVCHEALAKGTEAYEALMANKPWSVSGDVNISITGGTIDPAKVKRTIAILGAGGSGHSVDGTVSITITGSETNILGDVIAGGSNAYAEVGATAIAVKGGYIKGSVYGGGYRDEAINQKEGKGKIAPAAGSTKVTLSGGSITGSVYGAGIADKVTNGTQVVIANAGTDVAGTIYGGGTKNEHGIASEVSGSRVLTVDSSYTGTQAYKVADFTNIAVNADATLAEMTAAEEGTDISIAEGKTLKLTGDTTYTAGNANGGTIYVDGANFELSSADSKLTSDVVLDKHASLDLNGAAVNNTIWVYGCSIKGANSFSGHLIVDGGELELTEPTSADKVTVTNGGSVTGGSLAANKVELIGTNDGAQQPDINTNLSVADNGTITLSGGAVLNVDGSLTLGSGVNIVVGDDYAVGTEIIKVSGDINQEENIEIIFGETKVVVQNGGVWLISRFDQNYADTFTVGNWGIITASRAFVDTVRGQRTNVGCIANGRGTAWAAVMGGNHDIAGSDINLTGAAVGADMKVGRSSSVGVALGYVDGDVKPGSLRSIDQDGTYLAVYGEHGLKKLDATSCLSLDWVAAYGNTESSVNGHGWEQNSLQLNSRLNWNKRINSKVCVNAFGGLEYFASNSNTVAGMKTGSIQSLRGEIGVGARYVACSTPSVYDNKSGLVLAKGCEKLVFNGEIRYMNDLERSNPVIRMEGMSGGSTNPGRQGMGIEAGATYRINERWSASANYGFNAMDDSKEHRINAGAAYTF